MKGCDCMGGRVASSGTGKGIAKELLYQTNLSSGFDMKLLDIEL